MNVAVVRLLAPALDISQGVVAGSSGRRAVDSLRVSSLAEPGVGCRVAGGAQQLRFYVCPKALLTTDSESFRWDGLRGGIPAVRCAGTGIVSVVVCDGKCAGVSMSSRGCGQRESWIYASWDSTGSPATTEPGRCGICRLPWLPAAHS